MATVLTAVAPIAGSKKCALCSVSGEKNRLCGKCHHVWYCSPEHQKQDWKRHRPNCHPFTENFNQKLGRVLIASRDIKVGEILFDERCLVSSPVAKNDYVVAENLWCICLGCGKLLKETCEDDFDQLCKACAWPLCKPDCPELPAHAQNECPIFQANNFTPGVALEARSKFDQQMPNYVLYDLVMVLRSLLLGKRKPAKFAKLLTLQSHIEQRKERVGEVRKFSFIYDLIHDYLNLHQFPDKLVEEVVGIIATNGMSTDEDMVIDGFKIYLMTISELSSKLSHSCISNTQSMQSNDGWTRVRAVREIKYGELLTKTFQHHKVFFEDIVQRREYLNQTFYFWCNFPRCSDPTELGTYSSGMKCHKRCHGRPCEGYFIPTNPLNHNALWRCSNRKGCGQTRCYNALHDHYVLPIKEALLESTTLEHKLEILRSNSGVHVHENHSIMLAIRCKIMNALSNKVEDMTGKAEYETWNNLFYDIICKADQVFEAFGLSATLLRGVIQYYKSLAIENMLVLPNCVDKEKWLDEIIICQERALRIFEQNEMRQGSMASNAYYEILGKVKAFRGVGIAPRVRLEEFETEEENGDVSYKAYVKPFQAYY